MDRPGQPKRARRLEAAADPEPYRAEKRATKFGTLAELLLTLRRCDNNRAVILLCKLQGSGCPPLVACGKCSCVLLQPKVASGVRGRSRL